MRTHTYRALSLLLVVAGLAVVLDNARVLSVDSASLAKSTANRGRVLDRNGGALAVNRDDGLRWYPFAALAAHTLGYTGVDRETGHVEGRLGVELFFDTKLRKGEDVIVTLDARLQSKVEKVLRESGVGRAAVVVLDPANGDLLAIASFPNFDGNDFTPAISVERWRELTNDPARPLVNRAVQSYQPGSTFKTVVALAACRTGRMDSHFTCTGTVTYGSRALKCWMTAGHGELNLREALARSCNCYFYQLGNTVAIAAIAETAELLHLGARSGIGLAGEASGVIASPALLKTLEPSARWSAGYTAHAAIGQGGMEATPLQMATVAATIANGGRVFIPRLIANGEAKPQHDFTQECKPEHLSLVRDAMRSAVIEGTGKGAASDLVAIAGKTGTAQALREEGGSKVEDNVCWFIGYAPAEMPRFAFAVLVEGGAAGGATAAPIARRIMEAAVGGLAPPEPQPHSAGGVLPR